MVKPTAKAQNAQRQESESESAEDDKENSEDYQDLDNQGDQGDFEDEAEESILLKQIQDKIAAQSEDGLKLSWSAIHALKLKQSVLNEQMAQQLNQLKEKYNLLKQPIMKQLAAVVAGNKLEKELYAGNDATKSINLNRIKPKRIADYWSMAFQHCGIISIASDIDCFEKCLYFSCERFGENSQNLRIDMKFEGGCPYFTNTTLGLEIDNFFTPELSMSRRMTDKIAYVGDRNSDSIFTLLFDETTQSKATEKAALDVHRAYTSSTFFYFYDSDGEEDGEGEESEDGESEDEERDDKFSKAQKKVKGAEIEKPECKQQ